MDFSARLTIPSALARLIPEGAVVELYENMVEARGEDVQFWLPILAEQPPAFRGPLSDMVEKGKTIATFESLALKRAVSTLAGMFPDSYLELSFGPDELRIAIWGDDASLSIPCVCADPVTVKIKARYLLDSVPFFPEQVTFHPLNRLPGLSVQHNNLTIALYGARIQ